MSYPEGFTEVALDASRHPDVLTIDAWAFPSPHSVPDLLSRKSPLTWERAHGVEAAGRTGLVGVHASYPFQHFPVPGATTPVAGLTWVGVHPQYRRRGLLRSMLSSHFEHCLDRGEAISALTASEPAIYGRFGYGLASDVLRLTIPRDAGLRPIAGSEGVGIDFEEYESRHSALVEELHVRAGTGSGGVNRPGWASRESAELKAYWADDPAAERDGFEARRILVARRAGAPSGYALFRRKLEWENGSPNGTLSVTEAVALDAATARALWGRLVDLDLIRTVRVFQVVTDDPLMGLLVDPRAARPVLADNIWLRILDVPAALAARRYAADLDIVLAVTDELVPANAGRWHLRASAFAGGVTVDRTDAVAQVGLDIRELGSLYLGGRSASALAATGLVTGDPQVLAAVSTAFGWPLAPGSSWIF